MSLRVCIVVPVYNHAAGARALVGQLRSLGLRIILVDDGSEPRQAALLRGLAAEHDGVQVVEHRVNKGKGAAVQSALREASSQGFTHALQIDADGQHDTQDIPAMLALAERHPEAVITGRPLYDDSVPRGRLMARYLTHIWVWIETLSFAIRDSMCGFRVYPLKRVMPLLESTPLGSRMDFDPEILVRLAWQGTRVISLPTRVIYPEGGQSHFRLLEDNLLITRMHVRLVLGMLWRLPVLLSRKVLPAPSAGADASGHQAMHSAPTGRAGHWAQLEERGVYCGLKLMLWSYRLLGRIGFSLLLYPVMAYFFLAGGKARRASIDYLRAVYAQPGGRRALGRPPGWRHVFAHFMTFGEAILDKLLAWTGRIGLETVDFENLEAFEELQRAGGGGLLIASHFGNAEVCRALGTRKAGVKINVLVHTKHAANFNRLMKEESGQSVVSLIETTEVGPETAIMLRERVERGEFVVIVGDRTPVGLSGRYSLAPFLGREAPFPQGPYILAALMKCPVQLLFCFKDGERFRIVFEPFSDGIKLPRKDRGAALDGLAGRYAQRLECYCLKAPYQWFNFFDFWNQARPRPSGDEA